MKFLKFIFAISDVLEELFNYSEGVSQGNEPDPEEEKRIMGKLIRRASDEEMRKALNG